ncbi:MAG: hypothetical protein AAFX93_03915 [Verrucomicrobiota bacterium]
METHHWIIYLLYFAGAAQIFVALIYNWVRRILEWDEAIDSMPTTLNRQIAHTYSRYIQGLNFAFGVITIALADSFLEEPRFGAAIALLLLVYWGVRFVISLAYYDIRAIVAQRPLYRIGNIGFSALFAMVAAIYGATASAILF